MQWRAWKTTRCKGYQHTKGFPLEIIRKEDYVGFQTSNDKEGVKLIFFFSLIEVFIFMNSFYFSYWVDLYWDMIIDTLIYSGAAPTYIYSPKTFMSLSFIIKLYISHQLISGTQLPQDFTQKSPRFMALWSLHHCFHRTTPQVIK